MSAFVSIFNAFILSVVGRSTPARHMGRIRGPDTDARCRNGVVGRVTYLQEFIAEPFQPAIYVTDCSPDFDNNASKVNGTSVDLSHPPRNHKRQENICPADCSNTCSSGSNGPSSSDCDALVAFLQNRSSQQTVSGLNSVTVTSGTCMFRFDNTVDSPVIWCDVNWAFRSNGVVQNCLPNSAGGACKGSRFEAEVLLNPDATSSPTTTTQAPPPASSTDSNGAGGSTDNGNNGNTATVTVSVTPGSQSTVAAGSDSGSSTTANQNVNTGVTFLTTTDSAGHTSVATISAGVGTVSLAAGNTPSASPNGGSSTSSTSGSNSQDIGPGPNGNHGTSHVTAIVGAILGALALLGLLVVFILWKKKRERERQHEFMKKPTFDPAHSLPRTSADLPQPRGFSIAYTTPASSFQDSEGTVYNRNKPGSGSPDTHSTSEASLGMRMSETSPPPLPIAFTGVPGSGGLISSKARRERERARARERERRGTLSTRISTIPPTEITEGSEHSTTSEIPITRRIDSFVTPPSPYRSRVPSGRPAGFNHDWVDSLSTTITPASRPDTGITGISPGAIPSSIDPRTLAQLTQAAAPNLSDNDIDRLAQSIVAHMQTGRGSTRTRTQGSEITTSAHSAQSTDLKDARSLGGAAGLSASDTGLLAELREQGKEDEPPPPWRASWSKSANNG